MAVNRGLQMLVRRAHAVGRRSRVDLCSRPASCCRRLHGHVRPLLRISEEVQDAVSKKKPVVALESAIYTHGFPYPENVGLASHLEALIRSHGAVPATIGVLHGEARVGFNAAEMAELASSAGAITTVKVSRRDLGQGLMGKKWNGGTTVAATMLLAELAGIPIFATGGLGGVHRGGEESMDISADLTELGRTRVAVVSSGCKSFLDIGRTLEYLETQGVGVCTFTDGRNGQVDFPAFWSRDSGCPSPTTIQDEEQAAAIIYAQMKLPISSGLLFANPIPEQHAIPKQEIESAIAQAVDDAQVKGSTGNTNTPFILRRIRELTEGKSVSVNKALIESNVVRAAKVAHYLANLLQSDE